MIRIQLSCALLIVAGVAGGPHVTRAQGPRVHDWVAPTPLIRPWRPVAGRLPVARTPILIPQPAADSLKIRSTYWLEGGIAGTVGGAILGWFWDRATGSILFAFAGFFVGVFLGGQVAKHGP